MATKLNDKRSFIIYYDYKLLLENFPLEDVGKFFLAICNYAEDGTVPEDLPPAMVGIFNYVAIRTDYDMEKWNDTKEKRTEVSRLRKARERYLNDEATQEDIVLIEKYGLN